MRLTYLARILQHAPPALLRILDSMNHVKWSWTEILKASIEWIRQHGEMGHGREDWDLGPWIKHAAERPQQWKRECNVARTKFKAGSRHVVTNWPGFAQTY